MATRKIARTPSVSDTPKRPKASAAAAKHPAKKTATAKSATKKSAAKKLPTKKAPAKKSSKANYTDPALREKIKQKVTRGDKGGKPNQWSARKAQLVAHEYEAEGGGYKHPRDEAQQHLKDWGDEKWRTADGKPAIRKKATSRYLPEKAWDKLTPAEKKATDAKKKAGSKEGRQFVPNTEKAKTARRKAAKSKS